MASAAVPAATSPLSATTPAAPEVDGCRKQARPRVGALLLALPLPWLTWSHWFSGRAAMWTLVLAAVAVARVAGVEGGLLYATAPQDRGQYHRGSGGSYNYGYNTGDGVAKVEVKREDGSVVGSYRYFDPNGKQIVRSYIADSKGFRILGNDLPISPETPAANIIGAPALTAPVEGASQAVVDASLHPTKRQNTLPIDDMTTQPLLRHYYQQQLVFQQQNDLVRKQRQLIEQQQRQLAALTSNSYDTNQITTEQQTDSAPAQSVQYNTDQNEVGNDAVPYYYYPFKYNYDFPAGFAYSHGGTVVVSNPEVIGVRGMEAERNNIAVGHRRSLPPVSQSPIEVVPRRVTVYRRPYVIGRAK